MNIIWDEKYSVDIKEIDEQHKGLFLILSEFKDDIRHTSFDRISIIKMIEKLKKYALSHFESEEKYLTNHQYPYYKIHKIKHNQFTEKVEEFQEKLIKGAPILPSEISKFIGDWLVNHIMKEYQVYAHFIKKKDLLNK
jgi:hemerythrin-like metal-binding protein